MDPMTLMALLSSGQGLLGAGQKISAGIQRRNAEKNFQNYEIPSGVNAMMDVMRSLSTQTEMPGSELLRSKMDKTTAQGVETAQRTSESSGDVLGLLGQVYSNQLSNAQNKSIQDAQFYQQNRLRYGNALETLGKYQTEKWKYNELYPYLQKMTAAGETDAAGGENISGGLGSMIDIAGGKANMNWMDNNQDKWMNNMLGSYQPGNVNNSGYGNQSPIQGTFDSQYEQRDFYTPPYRREIPND